MKPNPDLANTTTGVIKGSIPEPKNNVESPSHYTQGYLETIYVIEQVLGPEGFKAFCMGNWIKYKDRHTKKNGQEDLDKAQQYLEWAQNGLPKPVNGMYPRDKK